MINFRMLRLSDYYLWVCVGLLILIGFFAIFSATFSIETKSGSFLKYVNRHFISLMVAAVFLFFFAYLDYQHLQKIAWVLYPLMVILLVFVMLKGTSALGAQRWLSIGPIQFQPSEFSKVVMVISLAAFLKDRFGKINNLKTLLPIIGLAGLPFLLIFKQPDLGTALVVLAITLGMLIYCRLSWEYLVILFTPLLSIALSQFFWVWLVYILLLFVVLTFFRMSWFNLILAMGANVVAGLAFPIIWGLLKEYQKQRLFTFLNPEADPLGAGYHTLQSKIAVGAGMLWGRGFLQGTQTQLQYIPVQHADFIFSVVAEEFGFIGSFALLGIFLVMFWRMLYIAVSCKNIFGQLLAAGITCMFLFHVFVNLGMTLALLPVVGIPLPLVSFGGSALVANLTCIGIVQSIAMRREKLIF